MTLEAGGGGGHVGGHPAEPGGALDGRTERRAREERASQGVEGPGPDVARDLEAERIVPGGLHRGRPRAESTGRAGCAARDRRACRPEMPCAWASARASMPFASIARSSVPVHACQDGGPEVPGVGGHDRDRSDLAHSIKSMAGRGRGVRARPSKVEPWHSPWNRKPTSSPIAPASDAGQAGPTTRSARGSCAASCGPAARSCGPGTLSCATRCDRRRDPRGVSADRPRRQRWPTCRRHRLVGRAARRRRSPCPSPTRSSTT